MLAILFVLSGWGDRVAIIFSLINVVIFFWRDMAAECRRIGMNLRYRWNRWKRM